MSTQTLISQKLTNKAVVNAFYAAYQQHNYRAMKACLHPDVEFSDLAFERLSGDDVFAMWRWFTAPHGERTEAVRVVFYAVDGVEDDVVYARYEVDYSLGGANRINYLIYSELTLCDGRIVRHLDIPTISNYQFARMAMGFPKCLLALTPFFEPILRRAMARKLAAFRLSPTSPNPRR